jgi:nitroreductase
MSDKGDWFMFDTALAMQNLVLSAHAIGLGTVYIGLFDAKKAAGVLELPGGVVVVAMTPLGYPEGEGKITSRLEPAEMVFYGRYGKTGA